MLDRFGREIDYMRISITDRCNLRCIYCMPPEGIKQLSHDEILTFEEILRVVRAASQTGIKKIKITGGEPLVRKGMVDLISQIKETNGIEQVTLTTNGLLFSFYALQLSRAGLDGVNFSLDCLDAQTFNKITRVDSFEPVMQSIENSIELGFKTKINCVPIRGYNEGSLAKLAGLAQRLPVDVRFIELMPIGLGQAFESIATHEVLGILSNTYCDPQHSEKRHGNGPAEYYDFPGFKGSIGFVSALSDVFCKECNRVRLTSDGFLKTCLCSNQGIALKPLLRGDIEDGQLVELLREQIACKPGQHHLKEPGDGTEETKKMFQIGG